MKTYTQRIKTGAVKMFSVMTLLAIIAMSQPLQANPESSSKEIRENVVELISYPNDVEITSKTDNMVIIEFAVNNDGSIDIIDAQSANTALAAYVVSEVNGKQLAIDVSNTEDTYQMAINFKTRS